MPPHAQVGTASVDMALLLRQARPFAGGWGVGIFEYLSLKPSTKP
jgi:hypothetical protein